jgi:NAD(P)-dependent dehydrogenase (short-subunit alcohol dehydrogenase family)
LILQQEHTATGGHIMTAPDDMGLDGKVAIVTGGGAAGDGIGNGRAAAILMARAGARVLVVDRDLALAERTVEMIGEHGGEGAAIAADVTRPEDCEAMVAQAVGRWGRLDILDNNVGIGSRGSVVTEPVDAFERVMRVNVESMFLASKYAIPAMLDSGDGGAIVNVSSISALRPRGLTSYSTSKGAVIALTRAMANDHAGDGIRVNCVAPGPVYTPMVYGPGMSEEARATRRRASPLGIEGSGWDVGNAVTFLVSARARYITGQTLVVDGGITNTAPPRGTGNEDQPH